MLYLVSKPIPLCEGRYEVSRLATDDLVQLVRNAHASGTLESRIHYASTASAIRALANVDVRTTSLAGDPYITDADIIVEIRLKPGKEKGPVVAGDLEFWELKFTSPTAWPAIVND